MIDFCTAQKVTTHHHNVVFMDGLWVVHEKANLLFLFSYFGISTCKKNDSFADRVFTPQKKSKKTRSAKTIFF